MSLILNFEICQSNDCKDLEFTETTGTYNATYFPGGYGAPNITIADVLTAVLTITSPSGTIYTKNLFTVGFPENDLTANPYVISLTNEALEDGKWTFVYTISTISVTYTKTVYKLLYCKSQCCVNQMLEQVDLEDCGCKDDTISYNIYVKAWTFLQALKNAAKCGDVDSFTKIKKIIDKLCKNKDCKTCK